MTEAEWLASEDPAEMLHALQSVNGVPLGTKVSDRKLGLIRDAWDSPLCGDERYTLGGITVHPGVAGECYGVLKNIMRRFRPMAANLLRDVVGNPFRHPIPPEHLRGPAWWLDATAASLAHAACDGRLGDGTLDAATLAVLADALEEAGCAEGGLLRHLRGTETERLQRGLGSLPGHVRGCWVVDLILGRG